MKTNAQLKILKNIKGYLKLARNKNIDTSRSILCYFACWEETLGFLHIRKKSSIFKLIKVYLKSLYVIGKQSKYKILNYNKKKKFTKIFITWGYKNSFNKRGEFFDLYSNNTSKKNKDILWFVIYMDKVLPNKLNENVVILHNKNTNFNLIYFLKVIIRYLFNKNLHLSHFIHYLNSYTNFGSICLEKIKIIFEKNKIKHLLMPYEGQIFQKMICNYIKKNNFRIITKGFVHDFEPFYPSFFYDICSPDFLMISNGRKNLYQKYLNWPKKKTIEISSPRYKREDINHTLIDKICFPSTIYDEKNILVNFTKLIELRNDLQIDINKLRVKVHPKSTGKSKQKLLESNIKKILSISKKDKIVKKINYNKKTIIIIGISSLVILALQKGYRVIQLCTDPDIQNFNQKIWSEISCRKISKNIYEYKKKNNIFKFFTRNIT